MKKEDLKTGQELQERIKKVETRIERLTGGVDNKQNVEDETVVVDVDIRMKGNNSKVSSNASKVYTEKANTNLEYLNQLYRDNVLRTLEDCKNELEKEFELLGK